MVGSVSIEISAARVKQLTRGELDLKAKIITWEGQYRLDREAIRLARGKGLDIEDVCWGHWNEDGSVTYDNEKRAP